MNIYLFGENGSEKLFYRFAMEGVKEKGYKVCGFWRHDGLHPIKEPLMNPAWNAIR